MALLSAALISSGVGTGGSSAAFALAVAALWSSSWSFFQSMSGAEPPFPPRNPCQSNLLDPNRAASASVRLTCVALTQLPSTHTASGGQLTHRHLKLTASSGVSGCALQLPKTQCGRSLGQVTNLQYISLLFTKAPCQPLLFVSIQSVKDCQSKYCPPCLCTLAAGDVVSSILLILPPDGVWLGTKCCQSPPDTPRRLVGCTLALVARGSAAYLLQS
mmetsp:Transcript_47656/g.119177  ORF Transcript_47656/g.119177 Transcript_47656/m.119177 type:complete len:217 (-) Transcript_47656:39-689(-)